MSEMGSDEFPETPVDRLNNALIAFAGCVGESLNEAGKTGICTYGLTIGESFVPFNPDPDDACEEEEAVCSMAWVRVTGVTQPTAGDGWDRTDCSPSMALGLEVGILRCIEIEEGGEAPTATDVLAHAMQAMDDMNTILCAALGCEVWDQIDVGEWSPTGPLGGQYGGIWTFTVVPE